jgi:hypothetical protein
MLNEIRSAVPSKEGLWLKMVKKQQGTKNMEETPPDTYACLVYLNNPEVLSSD